MARRPVSPTLNSLFKRYPALQGLERTYHDAMKSKDAGFIQQAHVQFEQADKLPGIDTTTREVLGQCRGRLKELYQNAA